MAVYNEILAGRFNRSLQKLFGIKGSPPVPQLSSEIMSVHRIESGVENRYLESWNRFGYRASQGPTAAQNSMIRFRNPGGSNVVAVFEKLSIACNLADQLSLLHGPVASDLTNLFQGATQRLDARAGSNTLANTIVSSVSNAGLLPFGNTIIVQLMVANGSNVDLIITVNQEITLLPGDGLQLHDTAVNSQIFINAMWRERFLEDSERS